MELVFRLKFDAVVYELCCVGGASHGVCLACVVDCAHETRAAENDEHVITDEFYSLEFWV